MDKAKLSVQEMHCGHCVGRVEAALRSLEGVSVERVAIGSADVAFDPARTSPSAIAAALGKAGYPAQAEPDHSEEGSPGTGRGGMPGCCSH